MSVRLRMQRHGAKKRPFYRVVAADQRAPRDGRFIELLGTYDPLQKIIRLNGERVNYWVGVGAQPSDTVANLIKKLEAGDAIDLSKDASDKTALVQRKDARKERIEARRKKAAEDGAAALAKAAEAAKAAAAAKAAEAAEAAEPAAEQAE